MTPLTTRDKVVAFLKKHGWPDPFPSNRFKWGISPENGKAPSEVYTVWDGSFDSISLGKKLIFRRDDLKTYVHVHLDREDGESENKGRNPDPSTSMIVPPEIAREKRALAEEREILDKERKRLIEWDSELREQDFAIRKSHMAAVQIQKQQDDRAKATEERLKSWEAHLNERLKSDEEHILTLEAITGELSEMKEKHVIAGHITYVIEKIAGAMAIRGIKNFDDAELKKLPPGFMDDLRRFIAHRAESHLFRNIPDPYQMVGDSFERLPTNDDKYEFCRIVIRWLLVNNPAMIQSIAKEWQEEQREKAA